MRLSLFSGEAGMSLGLQIDLDSLYMQFIVFAVDGHPIGALSYPHPFHKQHRHDTHDARSQGCDHIGIGFVNRATCVCMGVAAGCPSLVSARGSQNDWGAGRRITHPAQWLSQALVPIPGLLEAFPWATLGSLSD